MGGIRLQPARAPRRFLRAETPTLIASRIHWCVEKATQTWILKHTGGGAALRIVRASGLLISCFSGALSITLQDYTSLKIADMLNRRLDREVGQKLDHPTPSTSGRQEEDYVHPAHEDDGCGVRLFRKVKPGTAIVMDKEDEVLKGKRITRSCAPTFSMLIPSTPCRASAATQKGPEVRDGLPRCK